LLAEHISPIINIYYLDDSNDEQPMFTKKWLRRIGFGFLGLFLLGVLSVYAEWKYTRYRGEQLLEKEVAKLDAEDPDWRAEELCSKRNDALPPKDQNSAVRASETYDLIPESFKKWSQSELQTANATTGVLPQDDDLKVTLKMYESAKPAIEKARTLRQFPRGGVSLVYSDPNPLNTNLESTQRLRMIASLLSVDSLVAAHEKRGNDAIRSVHATLNTARIVGDEPSLISMLIRIAITTVACRDAQRTLGWCEPNAGLEELQTALAEDLVVPRLTNGLRGERAIHHKFMTNLDNGSIDLDSVAGSTGSGGLRSRTQSAPLRRTLPKAQALMLDYFGKLIATDKLNCKERIAAFAALQAPKATGSGAPLMNVLMPPVDKMVSAENRCRAVLATTVVAIACERFRVANGRYPSTIHEIPKSLLPSIPDDPFTGNPLIFKPLSDGLVIYSVGADLVDDGGSNLDLTAKIGGDAGFKLLIPEKRRQPAPTKPKPTQAETVGTGSGAEPPP